jgi:hypothetical protein
LSVRLPQVETAIVVKLCNEHNAALAAEKQKYAALTGSSDEVIEIDEEGRVSQPKPAKRRRRAIDLLADCQQQLAAEREKVQPLVDALVRLRDCDFTITLPDRMDAVRQIAKDALEKVGDK